MASNETSKYKLSVTEGTELQLSLNGPTGPTGPANVLNIGTVTTAETGVSAAATITGSSPTQTLNLTLPKGNTGSTGPNTITSSTSTDKTGYIFGNGTTIAGATAAASAATANTLVMRDSLGAASFATTAVASGAAVTGSNFGSGIGLSGSSISGAGVYGASSSGQGGSFSSTAGTGLTSTSTVGTGANSTSNAGIYHHTFGSTGNNRSAVERVRGWFVWFFSTFTGRLKTADITENREWTLPNATGTIALIDSSQTFSQSQTFSGAFEITNASVKLSAIPTFADNSAASSLATGSVYKTSTGELRIKY